MKADRTVIVVGVFIFLIGLAVAWSSYGFIQVERGWSMVISGTIAFSAGLILVALGLILRQLRILSASAAQAALFLAKAGQNAQPVAPPAAVERAPEEDAEAQWAPPEEDAGRAEQSPAPAAEQFAAPPPAWMTRATTYAAGFGAARMTEPDAATAQQFEDDNRDWLAKAVADEVAAQEDLFREVPVDEAGVEHAQAPEAAAHEAAAAEFPAEEEREETVAEPPSANAGYDWEIPVEAQEPHETGAEHEPEGVAEPAPEPHAEFAGEAPEEPAEPAPPAILGQYEANGARYTMYVDGSIDAETPHGVYRFASMDELKRFLARGADQG